MFMTGKIVEDFVVLYKVKFQATKLKWFKFKSSQPFQV